jgi:hypothetical protein
MSFPKHVITGDINLESFNNLWTQERGIIWRGFTHENEMTPSAADYGRYEGEYKKGSRTEPCHPLAEIKRIAEKIYSLNKLQKFPFEIPLLLRRALFSAFYQPEEKLFKDMHITEFPDHSLAQAMALVQHEWGGTSLLDFSTNKYKALYFAIGRKETVNNDSYIFGLSVPDFETQKGHLERNNDSNTEVFGKTVEQFDLIYPSYFMNDRIAHQEGVFLHQRFTFDICGHSTGSQEYKNIIDYFESRVEEGKGKWENGSDLFQEISIDDFLRKADHEGELPIFYLLLKVPAKVKPVLKAFLNTIGVTDEYMMNAPKSILDTPKNDECS